jgi:gamma-glutamyltranspeptidase/glutathione hydrolase
MVVTNHPLASAAGSEILAEGGNAIDAAVAALFALTVVEPMMVGIAGGGISHLRLADGKHLIIDAMATAPATAHAGIYTPISDTMPDYMEVENRRNIVGPSAVAVPGNLAGWCDMLARFGKLPLADVVEPSIRFAQRGFVASHYLAGAIRDCAGDMASDPEICRVLVPDGQPLPPGARLVQPQYAETLELIAREGASALYGGALGKALADRIATGREDAGWLSVDDLRDYRLIDRSPVSGSYREFEVLGPPPPASGIHVLQMLNMLELHDLGALGFGTPDMLHLIVEVMRIAFEDRRTYNGDPAFVDVPVERLISKAYAREAAGRIRERGGWSATPLTGAESPNTTHVTVADKSGNVVAATHTINWLFGARFMVPGTGIVPNNYMANFDPHPDNAMSIAPGKRVPTAMSPTIVLREGRPAFAVGLPGGTRIFPSAMLMILNVIDHGMPLQYAVEAPRIWTQGEEVEIENGYEDAKAALDDRGHDVRVVPHIGGGMNAVAFSEDGRMEGASCWRADGNASATSGGFARPGVRFWPDRISDED